MYAKHQTQLLDELYEPAEQEFLEEVTAGFKQQSPDMTISKEGGAMAASYQSNGAEVNMQLPLYKDRKSQKPDSVALQLLKENPEARVVVNCKSASTHESHALLA